MRWAMISIATGTTRGAGNRCLFLKLKNGIESPSTPDKSPKGLIESPFGLSTLQWVDLALLESDETL